MAALNIADAQAYYRAFADLLISDLDDKHIARKLGCSRGEVKRRRQAFSEQGIIAPGQINGEKLDAWLTSKEGLRAQQQWEAHHQQQQRMGASGTQPVKGTPQKPTIKRAYLRPKV